MKKRSVCILNAVLAFIVFLLVYGNICYLYGTIADNPKGGNLGGGVFLAIYFLVLLIIAIYLIHNQHYTKKPLLVGAVYSTAYGAFVAIGSLLVVIFDKTAKFAAEGWELFFYMATILFSLLIGGLYFYAAFGKRID